MPDPRTDHDVEGTVTINMPCQYGYLRIARQSVMEFGKRAGLSEYQSAQLEMAVDEACTNVIEHSYGGEIDLENPPEDHPGLQMNLFRQPGRVVVEIIDRGAGFDYREEDIVTPEDYLEHERVRGLGLYIIRNFVDEMAYERGKGGVGNCLRLVKRV